ncbi:MAG: class I SAM-dependent rRNA methyltransferase [Lachnospiraceae bacterium]|jgi:23S rRNA (cytosine1962-C5)-methyltransferase|nr:class I SAM-dependent rRNA methyltransferase [Lachnospiraceae bacterium]MCI1328483.1 class I SAM-dependent rRNA methyltransferase [Lachnospiraceae bacterium]
MQNGIVKEAMATLKKGAGREMKQGGAWIYDNEIESVLGKFEDGDVIRVQDFDGFFLGYGFINTKSKIRIRMLSRRREEPVDEAFIRNRARSAWNYRKDVMTDRSSCRVVFGEADFLPGLIVDKYEDVLVVQSLALGIDRLKGIILDELKACMEEDGIRIRGVYERSDASVRRKEGLEPVAGFIGPEFDTNVPITENGVHYLVDVKNGQKTGFFLDQKYNRLAIRKLCAGKRVLDCFTHMGTFALNAAAAGAESVRGIDISELAVEQARENARRNHLEDRVSFDCADVFDELPELVKAGEKYDVVILDPPAFTKSRQATKRAVRGYRDINLRAMHLVKDGGYLATCSCSHFMTQELFEKTIREAARDAHRRLRQVEFRTQGPDHPILWTGGESSSYYLKFYIFQVCEER